MKVHVTKPESNPGRDLSQVEAEFAELLKICAQGTSALEIGSLYGGSAKCLAESMPIGSRMVSVDLGYENLNRTLTTLPALIWRLERVADRDVHLVIGNSMWPEVVDEVKNLGPFDLVFIDGGHEEDNVLADWRNYGPMGKVVAFHDIRSNDGARNAWNKIKGDFRHEEFVHGTSAGMGVIWKS